MTTGCASILERKYESPADEPEIEEPTPLSLLEYTIVRGDSSGNPVLKQALNLRAFIREKCRNDLPLTTDFTPDEGKAEILVGYTNRQESQDVAKELNDSVRFIIRTVGNKIVIAANTQNNLAAAIEYFANEILPGKVNSVSDIDYTQTQQSLILMNVNNQCHFVIPDNASKEFATCAQSMLDTLKIPDLTLTRYSAYNGGTAVIIGNIPQDEISAAYALSVNENEYIARTAAGNVYLQGYNDLLTLTAFGDFLVNIQTLADRDMDGNRCLSTDIDYSFNSTWEFSVPKPLQATLDNSESITGACHIFYYSSVSEHAYSLFKQMLSFLGYTASPYSTTDYQLGNSELSLNYLSDDQTLSVLITAEMS
ncbi:MAG: hypothetical protein E7616_00095 [Ruminococcaceae bacterium]|nr:hypothetical protein [Oscillospiraceae bacterium]